MKRISFLFLTLFLIISPMTYAQKFEPRPGECLVFIGQDLGAVGGLADYNNGYLDYFELPAGITVYSNLSPGDESYGYAIQGLDGLKTMANWGAGDNWAQLYIENAKFDQTALAIGFSMVNHDKRVAKGEHDELIRELAQWIQSTNRPVFLRIGYEFDGWDWNNYKRKHFLQSWKRIHTIFQEQKVENVAFVWQSKGTGSNQELLGDWYPGDEFVDWCAYSYFGEPDQEMIAFARKHNKPVFIAEATPVRSSGTLYFDSDCKKDELAETIWKEWYVPFFETIEQNSDVVKAFSYINVDWPSQPMWVNNPVFKQVDSRIQVSEYISKKWKEELAKPKYLHAKDEPF